MDQDTQPAAWDGAGGSDDRADFRVADPRERLTLLRQLRDGGTPVYLSTPDGVTLTSTLWAVNDSGGRLNFSADKPPAHLQRLVDAEEAVAVAYLDSIKLQFDLHDLLVVRSANASTLQAGLPSQIYRFQRRQGYRVRPPGLHVPTARLRHPSMPEMTLALRVLDVSIGGCALLLPHDVPDLQPGTTFGDVQVDLDADTRFRARLTLHHVTSILPGDHGVRLGCSWSPLEGVSARSLQRWIDQTQKRRRLLRLG